MTYSCEYCGCVTSFGPAPSARFDGLIWPACCLSCERAEVWRPIHADHTPPATRGLAAAADAPTRRRVGVADETFYHEIVLRIRPPTNGGN